MTILKQAKTSKIGETKTDFIKGPKLHKKNRWTKSIFKFKFKYDFHSLQLYRFLVLIPTYKFFFIVFIPYKFKNCYF